MRKDKPAHASMLTGPNRARHRQRRSAASASGTGSIDLILLFCALALLVIGIVMVYSSSAALSAESAGSSLHYLRVQLIASAIGVVIGAIAIALPIRLVERHAKHLVILSLLLMLAVYIPHLGVSVGGFRRWLRAGPFLFQPLEFAKLALIVYIAAFLSRADRDIRSLARGILPNVIIVLVFVVLLMRQPDFGSAVLLCAVLFSMLLAGGARASHLILLGLISVIPASLLLVTDNYRWRRIESFIQWIGSTAAVPDDRGYQIWQSYNALSSGGIMGSGLGDGIYKLFYLPAPHTDFIFSVLGEELGLIGGMLVIALFTVLIVRGIGIALRVRDMFPKMLAFGVTMALAIHAFANIAMAIGLLPTKGSTLPFVSYGGSSLVITLLLTCLLLNVSRHADVETAAA